MTVLGIETSCDETAASVVRDGKQILSNVVSSSLKLHKKYGGVIPEIASRAQLELINYTSTEALKKSGMNLKKIGLISVTENPGLAGSLLVGISFCRALSAALDIPLITVDHLKAHIYAAFLQHKINATRFIGLVASGGHTSLFCVENKTNFKLLGQTLDDACGEAFDKVAKILNLGYPGGPVIEKRARQGDPRKIKFPCLSREENLDFSFSGIKTAVLYYVRGTKKLSRQMINDVCASFQEAVVDALVKKALLACRIKKVNTLVLGGGVASNSYLREKLAEAAAESKVNFFFPSKELCVDNAAMVAGLGYQMSLQGG